jgi:hypothetical protein
VQKTILDISCESLDLYFARQIEGITEQAKIDLPRDIAFKLFRKGGEWDAKSTSRLSFLSKMFVLLRALKKRFFLVIEDEQEGIGVEQFQALISKAPERDYSLQSAEQLLVADRMVLANKELVNAFHYLNFLSTSPAYNYLLRNKNVPPNKVDQSQKELAYIVRFLTFWETNRKTMTVNTGVTIPEFYVLLSLFDGEAKNTAFIYKEKFKRTYQSSTRKIKNAFGTLQAKRYISKIGEGRGAKMQITALGKDALSQILKKYAIDC